MPGGVPCGYKSGVRGPAETKGTGPGAADLGIGPDNSRPVLDAATTPEPLPIEVLYEDEILLVVNKPAGLATNPRGRYVARSVIAQLRWARGDRQLVAAHRLDRLTSGVLVVVKDPAWRGRIQGVFEKRSPGLEKGYRARTGIEATESDYTRAAGLHLPVDLSSGAFDVELPLLKPRGSWQVQVSPGGRLTRTTLRPVPAPTPLADLYREWELAPHTGYTHQLRVVLTTLGYPIVGDPLYPEITPTYRSDAGDRARMYLHAESLTLPSGGTTPHWPQFVAPTPWE